MIAAVSALLLAAGPFDGPPDLGWAGLARPDRPEEGRRGCDRPGMANRRGPAWNPVPGDPWRSLDRTAVASTDLEWVAYQAGVGFLVIGFRDGSVYGYDRVPPDVYRSLLSAPSKGVFFHSRIKSTYSYRQLA